MPAEVVDHALVSEQLERLLALFHVENLDHCFFLGHGARSCQVEPVRGEFDTEAAEFGRC